MNLVNWRARISKPDQIRSNLHAFNDDRDGASAALDPVRGEFDRYLASLNPTGQRCSPTRQLRDFCRTDSIRIGSQGASVRSGRRFSRLTSISQKGYRALEMATLRIDASAIDSLCDDIAEGLARSSATRPGPREVLQRKISRKLAKLTSRPVVAPPVAGGLKLGATRGRPSSAGKDELAWITCQSALAGEMGKNPEDVRPAFASLYAAAYHRSMGLPMTRFYSALSAADRGLLLYEIEVPPGELATVRQPNLFSGGNPKLFVTRPPPVPGGDDMPGRTVRLIDTRCCPDSEHALRHCPSASCGREGLPEAVIPFSTIGRATIDFRGVFILYPSEANHYRIPSCDLIRANN